MMEVIRGMSCKPTCEELTYVPDFDAYFGNTDLSDPVSEGIKNTPRRTTRLRLHSTQVNVRSTLTSPMNTTYLQIRNVVSAFTRRPAGAFPGS